MASVPAGWAAGTCAGASAIWVADGDTGGIGLVAAALIIALRVADVGTLLVIALVLPEAMVSRTARRKASSRLAASSGSAGPGVCAQRPKPLSSRTSNVVFTVVLVNLALPFC